MSQVGGTETGCELGTQILLFALETEVRFIPKPRSGQ